MKTTETWQMADSAVIRVAAGSLLYRCSPVWRFWANKSDVYFAARSTAGIYKISLHESGAWISAFTAQSARTPEELRDRRHKTWRRPPEFTPGWTHGPAVLLPWAPWQPTLPVPPETVTEDTIWVPCPKEMRQVAISLLIASPNVPKGGEHDVSIDGDRLIGTLDLANGEKVWLQIRETEMNEDSLSGVRSAGKEYEAWKDSNAQPDGAWGIWVTTEPTIGVPLVVGFPLAKYHFGMQ
jgi:hypothetical protein